jgi:hypothetical protein
MNYDRLMARLLLSLESIGTLQVRTRAVTPKKNSHIFHTRTTKTGNVFCKLIIIITKYSELQHNNHELGRGIRGIGEVSSIKTP